jgi:hypothetical protein
MTDLSGLTYYIDPNVNNLLEAIVQFILMQKVFFDRIINLVPDEIQTIDDALRLTANAIIIIKDHFSNVIA